MATITSVSANPTTVASKATSKVTPVITNPSKVATISLTLDGATGTATIAINEPITYSVAAADIGKTGFIVATVDQGGTLAVGADGASFVFTAS